MALIDEFVSKVRAGAESFILHSDKAVYRFMSCPADLARFYYAARTYGENIELEKSAEICAIVKGKDIYMVDGYLYWFGIDFGENNPLPKGVKILSEAVEYANKTYAQEEFEKYLADLPVEFPEDERSIERGKKDARWEILAGKKPQTPEIGDPILQTEHVVNAICCNGDLRVAARQLLETRYNIYQAAKNWAEFVRTMTMSVGLVEPWEQRLADALRSVDAQNVTLEFNYKGVTVEEKFSAETLMRLLVERDDFSSFSFPTMKGGEKLFKLLGIPSGARYADRLFCSHITRMSFRGKTLYQKEESK